MVARDGFHDLSPLPFCSGKLSAKSLDPNKKPFRTKQYLAEAHLPLPFAFVFAFINLSKSAWVLGSKNRLKLGGPVCGQSLGHDLHRRLTGGSIIV